MRKLLTGEHLSISRGGVARHALSATTLLLVGFLVVALAQLGGGPSGAPANRGLIYSSCSQTSATTTPAGYYYTPTKTVTRTAWRTTTVYKTRTVTVVRTRYRTICQTVTDTTTQTVPTTETTTETVTEKGPTTTVTVTGTQSGSASAFTCPPTDQAGFAVGVTDYTGDPIFCSYPAFAGEDPNDFYCTYSSTTGTLVADHNAGFCPATAPPET